MRFLDEMPKGNFKPLKNYNNYFVSDKGVIVHYLTNGYHKGKYIIIKPQIINGKTILYLPNTTLTLDRVIYQTFIDDSLTHGDKIIHKDGNWNNNSLDNLEKVTMKEYLKRYPFKNHVKIIDDQGNEYPSMVEAGRKLYVSHMTIRNYLKDDYKGRLELKVKRG